MIGPGVELPVRGVAMIGPGVELPACGVAMIGPGLELPARGVAMIGPGVELPARGVATPLAIPVCRAPRRHAHPLPETICTPSRGMVLQ